MKTGNPIKNNDMVVFSLGEIDVRCHINKHDDGNNGYKDIINNMVKDYFDAIIENISQYEHLYTGVYNVVPPQNQCPPGKDKGYPILGSQEQRNKYTLYMNEKIKEHCILNDFVYIDIYDKYCQNNYLNNKYSNDGYHITDTIYLDKFFYKLQLYNHKSSHFSSKNRNLENSNVSELKMNFISGEKIQSLCDIYLGLEHLTLNPNIDKDKIVFINKFNEPYDNPPLIYCYTHILYIIKNQSNLQHGGIGVNSLIEKLLLFKNPFKLVFHNSDFLFDLEHLILLEKLPLLQYIYTQNMNVVHKKVLPLPIGLANSMWAHVNSKIHHEVYNMPIKKTKEIYFNFTKDTNTEKRTKCYNDIIKKGIKWNENLPYKEYLIELKRHKYAICPQGNGIDTHRFWECLYMNTIPICLKNTLTEYYKQYFPIIILNNWQELEINKLDYSYIDHQYLDMKYIEQMLKK